MDNKDIDWDTQIRKLIKFSNKKGYEVIFIKTHDGISTICFDSKLITIHNKLKKERQFYSLAHELGHLIINELEKPKYEKMMGYQYAKFSKQSLSYKIAEIEEEFEAWRLGLELCKKLKLKVDREKFERFKSSLLSSYLVYAVRSKI